MNNDEILTKVYDQINNYFFNHLDSHLQQSSIFKDLNDKIANLQYELKKQQAFNIKVNQAYINLEVQLNYANQQIAELIEENQKLKKESALKKELAVIVDHFSSEIDTIKDTSNKYEIYFKDFANENELIFKGLIKLQQELTLYVDAMFKVKIFTTTGLTVLSYLLFLNQILDPNQYLTAFYQSIDKIIKAYQKEGINIDISQELEIMKTATDENNILDNIISNPIHSTDKEENSNIINLNNVLHAVNKQLKNRKFMKYKINKKFHKKDNDKKDNDNDQVNNADTKTNTDNDTNVETDINHEKINNMINLNEIINKNGDKK